MAKKSKGITAKQRAARKRNMAIARQSRHKNKKGGLSAKSAKIAKIRAARKNLSPQQQVQVQADRLKKYTDKLNAGKKLTRKSMIRMGALEQAFEKLSGFGTSRRGIWRNKKAKLKKLGY